MVFYMYYMYSFSKRTTLTHSVAAMIRSSSLGVKLMSNGVFHWFKDKFWVCFNQTRGEYGRAKAIMLSFNTFMTRD